MTDLPEKPILVLTSSLLDLILQPTNAPINLSSVVIVEEVVGAFLLASLEDRYDGLNGTAKLFEIAVRVKAIRFTNTHNGRLLIQADSPAPSSAPTTLQYDSMIISDLPSQQEPLVATTILTISVSFTLRGDPDALSKLPRHPHHFDKLIFDSFRGSSEETFGLLDLLGASSDPILSSITTAEIEPTAFSQIAMGNAKMDFTSSITEPGAAVLDGNDISVGTLYSGEKDGTSATILPRQMSFRDDPIDVALVVMSAVIFLSMAVLIYVHRRSSGPTHAQVKRRLYSSEAPRTRESDFVVYNEPINSAHYISDGADFETNTSKRSYHLSGTKYHYVVPSITKLPSLNGSTALGGGEALTCIPEDEVEVFDRPSYFEPENLNRASSSISDDVFKVDVLGSDRVLNLDPEGDDLSNTTVTSERWNRFLSQLMVVDQTAVDGFYEDEIDADADDENSITGYSC